MFLIVSVNVLSLNLKCSSPPGNVSHQYFSIEFVILCCHIPFFNLIPNSCGKPIFRINRIIRNTIFEGIPVNPFENIVEVVRI